MGQKVENKAVEILENSQGAMGWIFMWLIGIPIPILVVLFLLRGCT
jgi:CHASE3 domain sensor protein